MIFTEISFGKVIAHTQSFFKGGGGKVNLPDIDERNKKS
jgi:hypothetical protein